MRITAFGESRLAVGEGPIWDIATQRFLAVDIVGQRIWEFDAAGGVTLELPTPEPIFAVVRDESAHLLVAMGDGIFRVDQRTQAFDRLATIPLPPGTRLNDAKIDPQHSFVTVAADIAMQQPLGTIDRVAADGSVQTLADGLVLGNGPCWSPDGDRFYVADSIGKQIFAYHYETGAGLSGRRIFADVTELGGMPDGATVDAAGRLWIALCGAGMIACFEPSGALARTIKMPTAWVSSVMFGGPGLDRMLVTSLDPSTIGVPRDAECGRLFMIEDLDAVGVAEPRARNFIAHAHVGE